MIADMEFNKKLSPIVSEFFLRGRNLTFSQSYFKAPKTMRPNATHYFIIKIPKRK